jgi:hypothetical protein
MLLTCTNVCKNDIFQWTDGPTGPARASSLLSFCELTHNTWTHSRPLDEGSARRRDLYLTTHKHLQETDIHAKSPGEFRTCKPNERAARRLTPWNARPMASAEDDIQLHHNLSQQG